MSGLLPCPFCGGGDIKPLKEYNNATEYAYAFLCYQCGAESGWHETQAEAIEAWNTRAERKCQRVTHGLERDREVATVSWTCSECGGHIGRDHAYCHNCGAKVVEE